MELTTEQINARLSVTQLALTGLQLAIKGRSSTNPGEFAEWYDMISSKVFKEENVK